MGDAPKKLVPVSRLIGLCCVLFLWSGYRLYRDHERNGGWNEGSVIVTAATVCVGLAIASAVF